MAKTKPKTKKKKAVAAKTKRRIVRVKPELAVSRAVKRQHEMNPAALMDAVNTILTDPNPRTD